ncbi:MAG: hypothetical protein AAF414_16950 [Pseudomonadota bacterium]
MSKCMAEIGISPKRVHPAYRKDVQDASYRQRITPQECTTAIIYNLALDHRPDGYQLVLSDWLERGLVRRRVLQTVIQGA